MKDESGYTYDYNPCATFTDNEIYVNVFVGSDTIKAETVYYNFVANVLFSDVPDLCSK